jgi:hypothetical protein
LGESSWVPFFLGSCTVESLNCVGDRNEECRAKQSAITDQYHAEQFGQFGRNLVEVRGSSSAGTRWDSPEVSKKRYNNQHNSAAGNRAGRNSVEVGGGQSQVEGSP